MVIIFFHPMILAFKQNRCQGIHAGEKFSKFCASLNNLKFKECELWTSAIKHDDVHSSIPHLIAKTKEALDKLKQRIRTYQTV